MIDEADLTDEDRAELAEQELVECMARYQHDPLGHVRFSYQWGEGDLAATPEDPKPGPDEWQVQVLTELGNCLRSGSVKGPEGALRYVGEAIRIAVASGHGIGKSALICWVILWAMSTFEDTKGIVTANTKTQLSTKTWSELAKWHRHFIASHWFKYEATSLHSNDPEHKDTWRIDAIPWSKANPEAFAGLHNQGKRILVIFDEGSAIEDIIWETVEGAETDIATEIIWLVCGNPTRNTGRFRECWRKFRSLWKTFQVDSRSAKKTNKKNLAAKIVAWGGLLSDYVKVRILGQFPNMGDRQFISTALVDVAKGKHLDISQYKFAPKIIGVDPAWTGGDETVIVLRQGLYSTILAVLKRNDDDNVPAGMIARFEDEHQADAVFVDLGWGTGIVSAGKLMNRKWDLVSFSESSSDPGYLNKRAEMWGLAKQWLKDGGAIPDDEVLYEDLIGPEYEPRGDGKIQLESKEDMKDRGLPSPNRADALVLTFARPVQKKARSVARPAPTQFTDGRGSYNPI